MKITLKEIKLAEAPLTKFVEQTIPIKLAYNLGKLVRVMQQELRQIEAARVKLVKQYGTESSADVIEVKPENLQQFNEEWTQLLETEIDLDFEPISSNLLNSLDIQMTSLDMHFISIFFKDNKLKVKYDKNWLWSRVSGKRSNYQNY